MSDISREDAWGEGNSYDANMGRWSRRLAPRFLDWLAPGPQLDWLDVGCGTGALSDQILARCDAANLIGMDPSDGFIAQARKNVPDSRAEFHIGDAQDLPLDDASLDVATSALALNFVQDPIKALSEMKRVIRPDGLVAFYVWDYPGGGVEFMHLFWMAATALDPNVRDRVESARFPFCTPEGLREMMVTAGVSKVETIAIEVSTMFTDFDDYWQPFTLGAGPAPAYCMSLDAAARHRLRLRMQQTLPIAENGSIKLTARAWALKGAVR